MKLKNNTQVIIADSEKYLVLRNQGDEDIIDLRVVESQTRDNPPTHEQGTDRPDRLPTPNAQQSAVENVDWHQLEKTQASKELASRLNDLEEHNKLTEIVFIADPATLGRVRPELSKALTARMICEIPKDLTHHTIPDIEKIIQAA